MQRKVGNIFTRVLVYAPFANEASQVWWHDIRGRYHLQDLILAVAEVRAAFSLQGHRNIRLLQSRNLLESSSQQTFAILAC